MVIQDLDDVFQVLDSPTGSQVCRDLLSVLGRDFWFLLAEALVECFEAFLRPPTGSR